MSQGCALLILRSKGQRSRSWRMVIWKWFPDDNWLCNQPMIMKLHTLTPHEFVGVGGGPVLLQQYFQYASICCPYMLPLLFCHSPRPLEYISIWTSLVPQQSFLSRLHKSTHCADCNGTIQYSGLYKAEFGLQEILCLIVLADPGIRLENFSSLWSLTNHRALE